MRAYLVELLFLVFEYAQPLYVKEKFGRGALGQTPLSTEALKNRNTKLCSLLRRTPTWAKGHQRLGDIAFLEKDLELSRASYEAVRKLSPSGRLHSEATKGLSKCHLAYGEYRIAKELLEHIPAAIHSETSTKELLGAIYVALEDYKKSAETLGSIAVSERSDETIQALQYSQARLADIK